MKKIIFEILLVTILLVLFVMPSHSDYSITQIYDYENGDGVINLHLNNSGQIIWEEADWVSFYDGTTHS